jgi:hypothetical protein
MRRGLALSVLIAAVSAAGPARADDPRPALVGLGLPLPPAPRLAPPSILLGEPAGVDGLAAWALSTPLRLSLLGAVTPLASMFPNCDTREDASGNSSGGVPMRRSAALRLVPSLVVHAFSSAGCPVDAGLGAAVTTTFALPSSLWLVAGAGVYAVPPHAGLRARAAADVRIDLMKEVEGGATWSVGVGRRGVSVGGTF